MIIKAKIPLSEKLYLSKGDIVRGFEIENDIIIFGTVYTSYIGIIGCLLVDENQYNRFEVGQEICLPW